MIRLLIKIGTTSLMRDGKLCPNLFGSVAKQINEIRDSHQIVVVTSGAIQAGREYAAERSLPIDNLTAIDLAGLGHHIYSLWDDALLNFGLSKAVMLITSADLHSKSRMSNIKDRLETYMSAGIPTLVNANDVTWPDESISMARGSSENDNLSHELHKHVGFDRIYFATEGDGVWYDSADKASGIIPILSKIEYEKLKRAGLISAARSTCGTGGIIPKIEAGFGCCGTGVRVAIGPLDGIADFAWGKQVGTSLSK